MRRALLPPVVGRIKILASMNSSEHRLPQDGRIRINEGGAGIDLRISIIPSQFGESVVIRVLARTVSMRSLDAIGFELSDLNRLRDLLRRSMGIVLVTGPTGSGKTTTLYAALQEVVRQNVNIITVEDPIEYELEGVIQTRQGRGSFVADNVQLGDSLKEEELATHLRAAVCAASLIGLTEEQLIERLREVRREDLK